MLLRQWILVRFPGEWTGTRLVAVGLPLLLAIPVVIAVHEVGHLLGGLAAGFRFSALRIGPLQIDRPLRISLQRISGTGYGGWVSMVPDKRDRLRVRALVLVLAGPGINLGSAGGLLLLPDSMGPASGAFIVVSLALAVKELLPIRHRITVSDGRRAWMLLRDRACSERWLAMMKLAAEFRQGVLPESLSADWLAEAIAYRDDSPDTVSAHGIAYAAAFHQHKDAEAGQRLETALQHASFAAPVQREALMSDAGVFQARRRKRADLAEQWLALMPQTPHCQWLRARVEAGILEARGDVEGALRKLDEVERIVQGWPDRARREWTMRLLARWREELRAHPAEMSI